MKKSKHMQKIIRSLVRTSFKDGKIVESQIVKSIKILKSLPKSVAIGALSEFLKEIKRKEKEHTLFIEVTTPFNSSQVKKIKNIVEKKILPAGRQVKISKVLLSINPEILGGFKLKVGDGIWDESILGKMNQVKEVIVHGGFGE